MFTRTGRSFDTCFATNVAIGPMSAVSRSVFASGPKVSWCVRRCDSSQASVNPGCCAVRVATDRRARSMIGFAAVGSPPWETRSSVIVATIALRNSASATNGRVKPT